MNDYGRSYDRGVFMPTYDYRCDTNGVVVEVKHGMGELLMTWGELCARSGHDPGDTPLNSSITRLATGGQIVKRSSLGDSANTACDAGPCCGGGICGQ